MHLGKYTSYIFIGLIYVCLLSKDIKLNYTELWPLLEFLNMMAQNLQVI